MARTSDEERAEQARAEAVRAQAAADRAKELARREAHANQGDENVIVHGPAHE